MATSADFHMATGRPRERRPPRMPNQLPPFLEERIVAFALGQPGLGPRRIAAQLRRAAWGGLVVSASGLSKLEIIRCLKRYVAREVFQLLPRAA